MPVVLYTKFMKKETPIFRLSLFLLFYFVFELLYALIPLPLLLFHSFNQRSNIDHSTPGIISLPAPGDVFSTHGEIKSE